MKQLCMLIIVLNVGENYKLIKDIKTAPYKNDAVRGVHNRN